MRELYIFVTAAESVGGEIKIEEHNGGIHE